MLEIVITIIGIVQGILAMLNKRINWLVYALQMALLVAFSYYNKLYGDTTQNAIYFFICIASWYAWKDGNIAEKIRMMNNTQRVAATVVILVFTFLGWLVLSGTDDPMPWTDSFTTITTFAALALMMYRCVETWVVWFVNDIAYMYQYFNLPDQALYLFGLYIIWTVMAIASFINWYRLYEKDYDPIADAHSRHCGN